MDGGRREVRDEWMGVRKVNGFVIYAGRCRTAAADRLRSGFGVLELERVGGWKAERVIGADPWRGSGKEGGEDGTRTNAVGVHQ